MKMAKLPLAMPHITHPNPVSVKPEQSENLNSAENKPSRLSGTNTLIGPNRFAGIYFRYQAAVAAR